MNKHTAFTIITVIVIIIIAIMLSKNKLKSEPIQETPAQELNRETQADSTSQIDSSLNDIDVDTKAEAELESVDEDIKTI